MTNFKYELAYKCKNQIEATELEEGLVKLGYKSSTETFNIYKSDYQYLDTNWNDVNNGFGFGSGVNSRTRILCDSKELFLALAAMRDSEEFFKGELFTGTSGWFNSMKDHAKYSRKDVYTVKEHDGRYLYSQEGGGWCNCTMSNARKLTKEEIIDLFSKKKEVTIKEDNKVNKEIYRIVVKGTKSLVKAFGEELDTLGYKKAGSIDINSLSFDYTIIVYADRKEYEFHNHNGCITPNEIHELPTAWTAALEACSKKVEKELVFEVGEWYTYSDDYSVGCTVRCTNPTAYTNEGIWEGYWSKDLTMDPDTYHMSDWKLATEKEIKQALIIGAKNKGFVKGVKVDNKNLDYALIETIKNSTSTYSIESDWFSIDGIIVYQKGKWATIISSHPTITVDEYTCEFHNNYVQFGCQRINAEDVRDLYIALESFNTERENYNDDVYSIMSITILKDLTISLKDIKQIVDYYQKKK